MKLVLQKNAKFSSAVGSAPRPPCLRRLRAFPPHPQTPVAGGFSPRLPLASGGWGLGPRHTKQPPHCEFLATCVITVVVPALPVVSVSGLSLDLSLIVTAAGKETSASLSVIISCHLSRTIGPKISYLLGYYSTSMTLCVQQYTRTTVISNK